MNAAEDPRALRIKAFAQANAALQGSTPLAQLERLLADCVGEVQAPVQWAAQGFTREVTAGAAQLWLHLQASAQVPLLCQRCLHPVQTQLTVDRDFRFVADEAAALAEDDVVEEDLLVLSSEFDLLTLLEDELLMALPLVPMHDACESEHMPTSNAENAAAQEKPNPFAALAALKRKPGD